MEGVRSVRSIRVGPDDDNPGALVAEFGAGEWFWRLRSAPGSELMLAAVDEVSNSHLVTTPVVFAGWARAVDSLSPATAEEARSRVAQLATALTQAMSGLPIAPDADVAVYARTEARMAAGPVVVVATAGVDGTVVWWYPDQWSADRNHVLMTACSRGVSVHTRWLHEIPEAWLDDAKEVYRLLREDPDADVSRFAREEI